MQSFDVKITIPEEYVLIKKIEYEDLIKNDLTGKYLSVKDICELTGKSQTFIRENLLDNPKRLKEIEAFSHFPQSQGDRWSFKAKEMREYLDKEFLPILRRV